MAHFEKLIIVPGHASFMEAVHLPLPDDIYKDAYWALQPFQHGEPPCYIDHIRHALTLMDDQTLLIFSGGKTRRESGRLWSEASSYDEIAKTFSNYPIGQVALEEYARDSFQNLEYSVRLFKKSQDKVPRSITLVGWAFKKERFQLHAKTIGIEDTFEYIGVNNPEDLRGTEIGEAKTLKDFMEDPRGDSGVLLEKRLLRDPWDMGNPTTY